MNRIIGIKIAYTLVYKSIRSILRVAIIMPIIGGIVWDILSVPKFIQGPWKLYNNDYNGSQDYNMICNSITRYARVISGK